MNRRNFLSLAALAIAGKAAERVFPFRVYSIPNKIALTQHPLDLHFLVSGAAPALFGGTLASVDEEAIQRYADSHTKAAMREFNEKLAEARFRHFHSGRFYTYNELLSPTAPQSFRP